MDTTKTKKPRRKGKGGQSRWSAVDTVILILVLLSVAGIVYRAVYTIRQDMNAAGKTQYVIDFVVEETHEDVLREVKHEDAVYLYEGGAVLGRIGLRDISHGAKGEAYATAKGSILCASGSMKNGALLIGTSGRYITPGSEVTVRTDRAILTLRITEIRKAS